MVGYISCFLGLDTELKCRRIILMMGWGGGGVNFSKIILLGKGSKYIYTRCRVPSTLYDAHPTPPKI